MNNSAPRIYNPASATQIHTHASASTVLPRILGYYPAQTEHVIPVPARPLLAIQRRCFDRISTICVFPDAPTTQRYFYEASSELFPADHKPYIVHEHMPRYQQEHVLECLKASRDYSVECPAVLFTSAKFFQHMSQQYNELLAGFEILMSDNSPMNDQTDKGADVPAVSCICLRAGSGGRWLLMDHESATTVSPTTAPCDDTLRRLLRHTVQISGLRLAPYLATMFDVPHAWKTRAELAACALLVFDQGVCATGCNQPGIPSRIIWDNTLGVMWR